MLAELRRLVHGLRPPALDDVGLVGALRQLADGVRRPGLAVRVVEDGALDALPAAGAVSHIQAIVTRDGDSFALWFGQEYSDYLAEVVIDAWEGLHA